MSALGQKQTCAAQNVRSALPPIATSIAFFGMSALGQKRTSGRVQTFRSILALIEHADPQFAAAPQFVGFLSGIDGDKLVFALDQIAAAGGRKSQTNGRSQHSPRVKFQ